MKKLNSYLMVGVIAIAMLAVVGCSDDDDNIMGSTPTSQVLIVHASPNAPNVDILVDDATAFSDVPFDANTGYVPLNAGTRNVKVNAFGTTTTVIDADLALMAGTNYTVFAAEDSLGAISALVLEDDLTAPAMGQAHVRFVHLSPNAPAVDVAVTGGSVLFGDYEWKEFTAFTPLPAGTYDLEVRVAGTSTVALPLPGITLEAGKIYTVYAKGLLGGTGGKALGAGIIVNN